MIVRRCIVATGNAYMRSLSRTKPTQLKNLGREGLLPRDAARWHGDKMHSGGTFWGSVWTLRWEHCLRA